jgi:nucleoside-diphosphate-sugar epimerase
MRVLVLGGTSFMGPHVVARLYDNGCEVAIFNRGQTQADLPDQAQHFIGDRRHLTESANELRRYAPHVVLDMIPITQQDARDLVTLFSGVAQRVVTVSSQDVYRVCGKLVGIESGAPDPLPLNEDAPLRRKLYPYRAEHPRGKDDPMRWLDDYDKILVERNVMADPDLPGTVLRLPMVYGPRDGQHRLFEVLKRIDDNRPAILMEPGVAGCAARARRRQRLLPGVRQSRWVRGKPGGQGENRLLGKKLCGGPQRTGAQGGFR